MWRIPCICEPVIFAIYLQLFCVLINIYFFLHTVIDAKPTQELLTTKGKATANFKFCVSNTFGLFVLKGIIVIPSNFPALSVEFA